MLSLLHAPKTLVFLFKSSPTSHQPNSISLSREEKINISSLYPKWKGSVKSFKSPYGSGAQILDLKGKIHSENENRKQL